VAKPGELTFGMRVEDLVTGFSGIITGRTEYINGYVQWLIRPPVDKDGKPIDGLWIDEIQLHVLPGGGQFERQPTPGGDRRDSPSTSYQRG